MAVPRAEGEAVRPSVMLSAAALLLLLFPGTAECAKRAVVLREGTLDSKSVRSARTAFLLPAKIDVRAAAADLVAEYDGRAGAGVDTLRARLANALSGQDKVSSNPANSWRIALPFVDLGARADPRPLHRWLTFAEDDYGVARLEVVAPDSLSAALGAAGVDYLVVLDAAALRAIAVPASWGSPTGVEFGYELTAQAFVWSRATTAVLWQAFVRGLSTGIDGGGARRLAADFAYDLWDGLK